MNNIFVQDVGADKDAITSLRAPTHYGRPNWDRMFTSIAEMHPETDVGVVSLCVRWDDQQYLIGGAIVLLWTKSALNTAASDVK